MLILKSESHNKELLEYRLYGELVSRKFTAYVAYMGNNSITVILNLPDKYSIGNAVNTIQMFITQNSNGYRAMGIGNAYESLYEIWRSYKEASISAEYCLVNRIGVPMAFESIDRYMNTLCCFQVEKENHIINCIKSADYEGAWNVAVEIIQDNMSKQTLAPNAIRHLFFTLGRICLMTLKELNLDNELSVKLDELFCLEDIEQMRAFIKQLYQKTCHIIESKRESRNSMLAERIKDYIRQNYRDKNLSLIIISDVFKISGSYLSRFFKDQTGLSFVDYINKLRIEEVKHHLRSSSKTLLEIAEDVGFSNDTTLRRLFKKYEGITPIQYKNMYSPVYSSNEKG